MISYNGIEVVTHKETFDGLERMALIGLKDGSKVTLTHKEWSGISTVETMEEETKNDSVAETVVVEVAESTEAEVAEVAE